MLYFKLDSSLKLCDISLDYPDELRTFKNHSKDMGPGWFSRSDIETMHIAQDIAEQATAFTGRPHMPIQHENTWPKFDVIAAPRVGDLVSDRFNGDSYPQGAIVKISASLRRIQTSSGAVYFRRAMSGSWVRLNCWTMVHGHSNDRNPEF